MEKQENTSKDYYTIDIMHILKSLWHRAWIIVLSGLLAAVVGFSVASFAIAPT